MNRCGIGLPALVVGLPASSHPSFSPSDSRSSLGLPALDKERKETYLPMLNTVAWGSGLNPYLQAIVIGLDPDLARLRAS